MNTESYIFLEWMVARIPGYKNTQRMQKKVLKIIKKHIKTKLGRWEILRYIRVPTSYALHGTERVFLSIPLEEDVAIYAKNVWTKMNHFHATYTNNEYEDTDNIGKQAINQSINGVIQDVERLCRLWGFY